ncbi:uncharacterized protein LOC116343430 [Contarinia nasturtii]|uniref:uncharacterized protein LOC116343430 n=1 Tax=Contarinia nasturtii TaxID=265458 RepID=UPI0012D48FB1|nr:uncharacterized protein LOC116343430 [Contarinia nasturtii]
MKFPTVPHCCCCVDLRIGGLIIGWLNIISACICLIGGIVKGQGGYAAVFVIPLIIYTCWLYGIYKNKAGFLLISVITTGIGLILSVFGIIFLMVVLASPRPEIKTGDLVPFIIAYCIITALHTYFWVVMYSIYKRIKEDAQNCNTQPV